MPDLRIAALFDAENIDCTIVAEVLSRLRQRGIVQTRMAIGDFTRLKPWIECAREHGIELVMQPNLGKGKNSADVALTIEAMDLLQAGRVNAYALITHDRDFTPLVHRLRKAGLDVFGFGRIEPTETLRAACSSFEVIVSRPVVPASPKPAPVLKVPVLRLHTQAKTPAVSGPMLSARDIAALGKIADDACAAGAIQPVDLTKAIIAGAPALATKLSGDGKFLKTLVFHGIVERVGSGPDLRVQRRAG